MYPSLIKEPLEDKEDAVLFFSTEQPRKVLVKNKVHVKRCENNEESLIIIDAERAYFGLSTDIVSFIASLPWIKVKGFCLCSKLDYNVLVIKEQKKLQRAHAKEIDIIIE